MAAQTEETLLTTLLIASGKPYRDRAWSFLFAEGLVFALVGVAVTRVLVPTHSGVLGVVCAAVALAHRFNDLLAENSHDIYVAKKTSFESNWRTATRVLALFLGLFAAYVVTAVWLGENETVATFDFLIRTAGLRDDTILDRRFGEFLPLVEHNVIVLVSFFALSIVYWGYGAVLALAWNASVWGAVLTILVGRALGDSASPMLLSLTAAAAVMPHLLLEAVAYVLASLAGIFLSKGLSRYNLRDERIPSIARAVAVLLVGAFAAVVGAAALETVLPSALSS